VSDDVFGRYSAYYDLLYQDKDYPAEADYVLRLLRKALPGVHSVLEFGSGSGRHGRLLAAQGLDVFGIERSASMVAQAKTSPSETKGSFDCQQGDIRTMNLKKTFDAVISLFHVVCYQTRNADLQATFANAARHLPANGVFLFDVWHGPAVLWERPSVRVKKVENAEIHLTRITEPELDTNSGIVHVGFTMLAESKKTHELTTFREDHPIRYLFPTEIDALATQNGFEIELTEEYLSGNKPTTSTWGVVYLLRKRG
jgi:SAM-dependent methyltransferase